MNIIGDNIILEIKIGGTYFPIGCISTNGITEDLNTIDSFKDGWSTSRPTNQGYSLSFSGLVTKDDISGSIIDYRALQVLKRTKVKVEWRLVYLGRSEIGEGYITSLSDSSDIDAYVSFSGSIVGWGAITEIASTWMTFDKTDVSFDSTVVTWDQAFFGG